MADPAKPAPRTGLKDRREAIAGLLLRLRAMGLPHALIAAFEVVPRQNFVPVMYLDESYGRGQLPIECGQVMRSADQIAQLLLALDLEKTHRVLEIGTGSGYQAALLGHLAGKVTSLERYRTLVDKAKQRLKTLEIDNVSVELADGSGGAPDKVFDRIVSNVSFETVPRFVGDQLTAGGVALVPIGAPDGKQMMTKLVKSGVELETTELYPVRMQPPLKGISKAI